MEVARISELLRPYLGEQELSPAQLNRISIYVDILTRWNERTNLTSIRDPELIVRRHFGESLFAAKSLLAPDSSEAVADIGSGAGFPGLPLKIFAAGIQLTLIEAHSKKNTFLREVVRLLGLSDVEVYLGRAEEYQRKSGLVTMRAVEKFETVLPIAVGLVKVGGRLALMIGRSQLAAAKLVAPGDWLPPIDIPESNDRILAVLHI